MPTALVGWFVHFQRPRNMEVGVEAAALLRNFSCLIGIGINASVARKHLT
jgi:hypothetical protein